MTDEGWVRPGALSARGPLFMVSMAPALLLPLVRG